MRRLEDLPNTVDLLEPDLIGIGLIGMGRRHVKPEQEN
jgi:hypothetical protein